MMKKKIICAACTFILAASMTVPSFAFSTGLVLGTKSIDFSALNTNTPANLLLDYLKSVPPMQLEEAYSWLIDKGILTGDFSDVDLSNLDINSIDLTSIDLSKLDLDEFKEELSNIFYIGQNAEETSGTTAGAGAALETGAASETGKALEADAGTNAGTLNEAFESGADNAKIYIDNLVDAGVLDETTAENITSFAETLSSKLGPAGRFFNIKAENIFNDDGSLNTTFLDKLLSFGIISETQYAGIKNAVRIK